MEKLSDVKKEIQFFNPHLVILDIKLPEKDGHEFLFYINTSCPVFMAAGII